MNFISEKTIESIINKLEENPSIYDKWMFEFSENQPFLLSFLLSDSFDVLNEPEKGLLFYLSMVIYFSVIELNPEPEIIDLNAIESKDEENWTTVDQNKFRSLKEIADHFFSNNKQEDLLALVEDALLEDEENELTEIGRKVIFVSMKSFIDVLTLNE